jgi:two-component system, OmpR family, osmolarity sensor histidine kinase EnvZ
MRRISLSLRLVLIVVGAMFLLQIVAIAVQVSRDDGFTLGGVRPAFAREVVALTRLFDRLPARRSALALELLNEGRFGLKIVDTAPKPDAGGPLLAISAAAIEKRIADEGLSQNRIEVSNVPNAGAADAPRGPLANLFGRHLRITTRLRDGRFLVIDPSSEVDGYVYGSLLAIVAGVLGLLILGVAVYLVLRETRPLSALAGNVETFARTATPRDIPEKGAPELRSLIRATNQMQHQIAALLRNRALILAGMSHDLRTQVTKLRLRLELLDPSPARDKAVADIEAMQQLIEETLEFAAAASGPDGGRTDITAVLDRMLSERAGAGNFTWTGHAPVTVAIGETALKRILENLVQNAIAYGTQADVSLHVERGAARIIVADRGPGVPPEERQAVFEPFYRIEGSRSRAHGGTGLGLAIVQQIVDRHGGSVEIGDRDGGGAMFILTLPVAN